MTESREILHQLLKSTIARPKVSSLQFLIFIDQLISEEVLRLLELGALLSGKKGGADFSENDVDGGCESVCVGCEEDYLIAMAYIAEQTTFKRVVDLSILNI